MTQIDRATFKSQTTTLYADNVSAQISAGDLRTQMDAIADSVAFKTSVQTAAPSATDDTDNTAGNGAYDVGDFWTDVNTNLVYTCVDASTGAAIWKRLSTGAIIDPQDFGAPSDGVSLASSGIQAAIDFSFNNGLFLPVMIANEYAIDTPLIMRPGVSLIGNANFDRRAFPNEFNGNRLYAHSTNVSGTLLNIGVTGTPDENPNGAIIEGVCFDGRDINQDHVLNLTGVYIRDTSDVYFRRCYFGGFDRTTNTGFCVIVEGSGEGNCFGTSFDSCILSNSQHGVFYTGLGTTDMRHSNNLYVGVTRSVTLGYDDRDDQNITQQGGAGMQSVNEHYTYTGMPTAGWFIRSGGQGGSLMVANAYFDQHGTSYPIRLGNAKAKFVGCHFLCSANQTSNGLIRVQTSASQQTIVSNTTIDLNNSSLKSLVHYTATTSSPSSAVITGNMAYGFQNLNNWIGHVILSNLSLVSDQSTASLNISGNVIDV